MPVFVRSPQYSSDGCSPLETRLLAIAGPEFLSSPERSKQLIADLRPVLRKGWQIAIGEANGTATHYATSAKALADMLNRKQTTGAQTDAAISKLNGFSGRKILVLVPNEASGRALPITDQQMQEAKDSLVDLLLVDGGAFPKSAADQNLIAANRQQAEEIPTAGAPVPLTPPDRLEKYSDGVYHEPSLKDAIRAADEAGFGYYDLVTSRSNSPDLSHEGISVKVNKHPPLVVFAEAANSDGSQVAVRLSVK